MACDLALMDVARDELASTFRLYSWSRPTISFGRHERVAGLYSSEMLAAHGLEAVRRPTGGRALLHHREITYSVATPIDDRTRWQEGYAEVNEILLAALQTLGVNGATTGPEAESGHAGTVRESRYPDGAICFSAVAPGEVTVLGRKLVASAVWRERGVYLQHGSVLLHDDQHRLATLLGAAVTKPAPAAPLSELLAELPTAEATTRAFGDALGRHGPVTRWAIPTHISAEIDARAVTLAQLSWLWRR